MRNCVHVTENFLSFRYQAEETVQIFTLLRPCFRLDKKELQQQPPEISHRHRVRIATQYSIQNLQVPMLTRYLYTLNKLRGLSPRANYTDRATAASR
jgi:hypothetical protein